MYSLLSLNYLLYWILEIHSHQTLEIYVSVGVSEKLVAFPNSDSKVVY